MTLQIPVSVQWHDTHVKILDQTLLPHEEVYLELTTIEDVYDAIIKLQVRGAPAIGITAAFGLALAASQYDVDTLDEFKTIFARDYARLASSRPTAVNLFWALKRLDDALHKAESVNEAKTLLVHEAIQIQAEDEATCRLIGEHALSVLDEKQRVMTICNAGSIATARYGTALAPFHLAAEQGRIFKVYACETRPVFQGSRLTTWELLKSGVDVTLITDSMAAQTILAKKVEAIIVGADRITRNGDTANKIGTWQLAILAKTFNIPFYVAAPLSTFDFSLTNGSQIPIEERKREEITEWNGSAIAPKNVNVYNPAFDVTPHEYITAIITERGVFKPNDVYKLEEALV